MMLASARPLSGNLSLARVGEGVVIQCISAMEGAFELVIEDERAAQTQPGQFFQIAVGGTQTLLRRPYSAAWADAAGGRLGFIFNVVGRGSAWLSTLKGGDRLDLLGPLGNGFDLDGDDHAVCLAGGLGVAVFPGVVRELIQRKRRVTVLLGARRGSLLMAADRFHGADVRFATDDGSQGYRGSVVEMLANLSGASGQQRTGGIEIFACGPTPMLQAAVRNAAELGISLSSMQIALETPMGCGMGTCLGCVAPRRGGGFLLTCQDGPCVRADHLDWPHMKDAFHG